jgi:hypothetical protein
MLSFSVNRLLTILFCVTEGTKSGIRVKGKTNCNVGGNCTNRTLQTQKPIASTVFKVSMWHAGSTIRSLYMLTCACMRSKAWFVARVSLRLALMPCPAQARWSRRLRAALAAAPVSFTLAFGPCRSVKVYCIFSTLQGLGCYYT